MKIYPPSLERLIEQLSRLPGIGQKSSTRAALFVLRSDKELAESLRPYGGKREDHSLFHLF